MNVLMLLSNPFVNDSRVYSEAVSLVNAGYKVSIIAWDRAGNNKLKETRDEIMVYRIKNDLVMKVMQKPLLQIPLFWKKAISFAKNLKFDVIHCHDLDTLYIGIKLKQQFNARLIYDAHEVYPYLLERDLSKLFIPLFSRIEKTGAEFADALIIADESYEDYFRIYGYSNITTVLNTKPLFFNEYIAPKNDTLSLVYVGSLTKPRFIMELIEVVGNMKAIKLMIAGKGGLTKIVAEKAQQFENIIFVGEISFDEIIPFTHRGDVAICMINPADKNNQIASANKQFEAMVAGRPIIATKGTRSGEITAQQKCGLVIDYNKEALKNAIERLRNDSELRKQLGQNALKAAIEKYNWGSDQQKLLNVYTKFEQI